MSHAQTYAEEHEVDHEQSLGSLIKEIRDESIDLFQQEIALARTEMTEKASYMGRQAYSLALSSLVAVAGLVVLLLGFSQGLSLSLVYAGAGEHAIWLGPTIVGLVVLVIGAVSATTASKKMEDESVVPEKTAQSLKENKQWLKDKTT